MSETEYGKLAAQLTEVLIKLSAMEERLLSYADISSQVRQHELAIQRMDQRCMAVQQSKLAKSVPWANIKSGVIIGLVVSIGMLIINYFVNK